MQFIMQHDYLASRLNRFYLNNKYLHPDSKTTWLSLLNRPNPKQNASDQDDYQPDTEPHDDTEDDINTDNENEAGASYLATKYAKIHFVFSRSTHGLLALRQTGNNVRQN